MAALTAFKNAQVGCVASPPQTPAAASDTAPTLACLLLQVAKEFPGYQDGEPFPGKGLLWGCTGASDVTRSGGRPRT